MSKPKKKPPERFSLRVYQIEGDPPEDERKPVTVRIGDMPRSKPVTAPVSTREETSPLRGEMVETVDSPKQNPSYHDEVVSVPVVEVDTTSPTEHWEDEHHPRTVETPHAAMTEVERGER